MSNSVDKRVVQMEFDNARFEKNVATTRNSIKNLKSDLNFDGNVQNISKLQKAANSFSMNGMAVTIENIQAKFSALSAVGFTVMQNLTNSVLNAGKKIASSTIGQMITGGKNRALNLEQAQFQISGLGVDWKEVTETGVSLYDQIDKAVSGTAYGLDAAAKVAGQLLASNIKEGTEDMQNALSGISGVAAMTNSTYEDIGEIFTKVAGNGRLMSEQLQQFSSRGLNAAATLAKELNVTEAEVRDMVSKGKVDFNTFAKAMNNAFGEQATKANDTYTGALSNVKAALSRIGAEVQIPLLENLRKTFVATIPVLNGIKKVLAPIFEITKRGMELLSGEAVKFLETFAKMDGKELKLTGLAKVGEKLKTVGEMFTKAGHDGHTALDDLMRALKSFFKVIGGIGRLIGVFLKPLKQAFSDIFVDAENPVRQFTGTLAKGMDKLAQGFAKLISWFQKTLNEGNALTRIFKGVFAAVKIVVHILKALFGLGGSAAKGLSPVVSWILKVAATIGDFIVKLEEGISKSGIFKGVLETIGGVFKTLGGIFHAVTSKISAGFKALKDGFSGVDTGTISRITNVLKGFIEVIKTFIKNLGDVLFGETVKRSTGLLDKLTSVGIVALLIKLKTELKKTRGPLGTITQNLAKIAKSFDGLLNSIKGLFSTLGNTMKEFQKKVKSEVFKNVATGLLMLAVALLILSTIDSDALYDSITIMGILFTELALFMKSFTKTTGGSKNAELLSGSTSLLILSTSVLILASAIKKLSKISYGDALKGILAVAALMEILVLTIKQLSGDSDSAQKLPKGLIGLIALAAAVRILVNAVSKLSEVSWEGLAKGVLGVGALIGILIGFIKAVGKPENMIKTGVGMIALAAALEILVNVFKKFSQMSWEELAKGGVAFAVVMGLLMAFVNTAKKTISKNSKVTSSMLSVGFGMIMLAASLEIMVHVIKRLGSMDTGQMIQGLIGFAVVLTGLIVFINKIDPYKIVSASFGMILFGTALTIMAAAIASIAQVPVANAGIAILGLTVLTLAIKELLVSIEKMGALDIMGKAFAMMIFAGSIKDMAEAVTQLGSLSVGAIVKGVGSILVLLYGIYAFTKNIGDDIKDIGPVVGAILLLAFAVKILASVSLLGAIVSIVTLVAVFGALALAVKMLGKHTKTLEKLAGVMLKLSGSMALMGLSMISFGLGLIFIGAGLTTIVMAAKEAVGAIVPLCKAIKDGAPLIVEAIFAILDAVVDELIKFIPRIFEAIKATVLSAMDTLIELIPKVVRFISLFIDQIAPVLIEKIPQFVDIVLTFVIRVLDALIDKVPIIMVKVVQLLAAIFGALRDAIGKVDPSMVAGALATFTVLAVLFKFMASMKKDVAKALVVGLSMVLIFGLLGAIFVAMAQFDTGNMAAITAGMAATIIGLGVACKLLSTVNPAGAVYAVAALAIFILGFAAIVAALGALKQIPGFEWLLQEGFDILALIGNGLGRFIGSIIGGIGEGMANSMPKIADSLSQFMTNLQPFLEGLRKADLKLLEGAGIICGAILVFAATDFITGIMSFFGGGMNFGELARQLCLFGTGLITFSNLVSGNIDNAAVEAAAAAGLAIAEMARTLPNEGGVAAWFLGDNSMAMIAPQLKPFGEGLVAFSDIVSGAIDNEAVEAACKAGLAIAEMAKTLPNEGGVVGWFMGENSMSTIAPQLKPFGQGLVDFSKVVSGNIDNEAVEAACKAGLAIAELANTLPNEGGVAAWFAGENSMATIAPQLKPFGKGLAEFSKEIEEVNPAKVILAAQAATMIAKMADIIPNEGGMVSWFAGDNSMASFAGNLKPLGEGLADFSTAVENINGPAVLVASMAGKYIADMISVLPKEGGIAAWFSGETALSKVADELAPLGRGLALFSAAVDGTINGEQVLAAAEAGKLIAEMISVLPKEGGVAAWFAGETSISKFSDQLEPLGSGLAEFSAAVSSDDFNVDAVRAAAEAGKLIAEMASIIPNEGGVVSWFAGDNSLAGFAGQFGKLGEGLADLATSVSGVDNLSDVEKAAQAGKALAEMADKIPNQGGVAAWFAGDNALATFADQFGAFGSGIAALATSISDVDEDGIKKISAMVTVTEAIVSMCDNIPNQGGVASWFAGDNTLSKFGEELEEFGPHLSAFHDSIADVNVTVVQRIINATSQIVTAATTISDNYSNGSLKNFGNDLKEFGAALAEFYDNAYENSNIKIEYLNALSDAIDNLVASVKSVSADSGTNLTSFATGMTDLVGSVTTYSSSAGDSAPFTAMGNDLAAFGPKLESFYETVDPYVKTNYNNITTSIKNLAEIAKSLVNFTSDGMKEFADGLGYLATADVDGFIATFNNRQEDVSEASLNFIKAAIQAIQDYRPTMERDLRTVGKGLVGAMCNGINNEQSKNKMADAVTTIATISVGALRNYRNDFYNIGVDWINGIVNGINNNSWAALDAAYAVANGVKTTTKKTLDINSPSKESYKYGKFWDVGFAGGITAFGGMVATASESVAENVTSITSDLLTSLNGVDFDDIQPTIAPVVDLTGVRAGVGNVSRIMSGAASYSISSSIARDIADYNKRSNTIKVESTSKDVVDAVGKLEERIDALGDRINGMGLYLDGKAVVGELTDPLDKSLGRKASKNNGGVVHGRVVQR